MSETTTSTSKGLHLILALDDFGRKVASADKAFERLYNMNIEPSDPKFFERTLHIGIMECAEVWPAYEHFQAKLEEAQEWLYQVAGPTDCKKTTEKLEKAALTIFDNLQLLTDITEVLHPIEKKRAKFRQRHQCRDLIQESLQTVHNCTKILREMLDSQTSNIKGDAIEKEMSLDDLKDPVPCVEVSKYIGVRSDNVAQKLKKNKYPVVKSGRKNYCQAEDAAVLWPKVKLLLLYRGLK